MRLQLPLSRQKSVSTTEAKNGQLPVKKESEWVQNAKTIERKGKVEEKCHFNRPIQYSYPHLTKKKVCQF